MKLKDFFTSDELCELRFLVRSEMMKASSALDKIGDPNNSFDKKLFSYWHEQYEILKSAYDKLLLR